MAPSTLEIAMSKLGYSQVWIDSGVISDTDILDQYSRLLHGSDPNPEHFRYAAFNSIFKRRSEFTSNEVDVFLEIAMNEITGDQPGKLGETLLHSLISQPTFSDEQLGEIANSHDSPAFRRKCDMQLQFVQLRKPNLGLADIEQLARSQYSTVQRALLDSDHPLSFEQLNYLCENGLTKAVRNIAMQRRQN